MSVQFQAGAENSGVLSTGTHNRFMIEQVSIVNDSFAMSRQFSSTLRTLSTKFFCVALRWSCSEKTEDRLTWELVSLRHSVVDLCQ